MKETSSSNKFLNMPNTSSSERRELNPINELKNIGRDLDLDLLKMKEMLKNRIQNSIVLISDDRDGFEISLNQPIDHVNVMKLPGMQLKNCFNFIQKHPSFGKGTIYVILCGVHDLLTESILNVCQLSGCLGPQTVFSLRLDTNDYSYLVRMAIDLEFNVLHATSDDIVLFSGLIPVDIERYNQFINKIRPCFASHPLLNIPNIDYVHFKNFLLTLDCYNEFTIYHAQKLGFMPWDLHNLFISCNSTLRYFESGQLREKMRSDGYHIPKEDCIVRADKIKELCQKMLLKFSSPTITNNPLEPSSSFIGNASEILLNANPFNEAQDPKKYNDNQLCRFDPVLAFDLQVMRELLCRRRTLNNIVLVTDEREDFDIALNGFDARINVLKYTGFQMKNAIDFVKKHLCFGKGTIFIFFCGIHDYLNSIILEDCDRHGCPFPQTLFTLSPNVIDNNYLIKTAMALTFEILSSTASDIALFCGLIPIDIGKYNMYTCMNRPCLAIHPALCLPVLDNFAYKSFISSIESYNDFTKRHAQSLGFTPWDLEAPFFDYGPGSAHRESNFIFQKMAMNGYFLMPQDNLNRINAVKLLCLNLLPKIPSVVSDQEISIALTRKSDIPPLIDKYKELDEPSFAAKNESLWKYSESQLENVKYIYQYDLAEIATSMNGRTQSNIVIVSDERDNFNISLAGYDSRVSILKVPGIKFSNALSFVTSHNSFGMGTIFIFSCGTHDLLQTMPVKECLDFHCSNPQTVLRLLFKSINDQVLIQKAMQLNRNIIDATKNDIVLFCGILPVNIIAYNNYLLDTRTCLPSHSSGIVPHLDPILFSCYENSLNCYNNFTKYHAQTLGFEPWDLEIAYFNKTRSVLHTNGFHVCESEDFERANEVKKLLVKLFQKLSTNKAVHNPAASKDATRTPGFLDLNVPIERDIFNAKNRLISPVKSIKLPDSNLKNTMPPDQCETTQSLKTETGITGKIDMSVAMGTQIDTILETSAFDSEIVSKYSQLVFVADKQYKSRLENFKHPNVTILADEHLKLNDVEEYLIETMKMAARTKTLYLIVTGIHTFTTTAAANLCLLNSCKSPLQAISYVATEEFCGKKLLTIIGNLKGHLPPGSHVAILPPCPLQLASMNISHENLHVGISLFPDYVIANFEFAVRKYYPIWMDSISSIALTSFVNCNLENPCFQRIITEQYKEVETIENFESCSNETNIRWEKLITDIVAVVLKDFEKFEYPIDDELHKKLECPLNGEFYFDHIVFILSSASLLLLPDITAYNKHTSYWLIDDIVESRKIFNKINDLNKMSLKSVLFMVFSDVTMVAQVEEHPYCIVRNCEHKLSFCRLQTNSSENEKKLFNLLSSIKIIISEIKMLSSFTSTIVMAPFTPKLYALVSDTNDEKQHNEMYEYMQKKNYASFLHGTTTSTWADLLLSFSLKWKILAKHVLCKYGGCLNEFMDVINAKVANLTLISWRVLSECSVEDDYAAFSSWQSSILIIIQQALKKSLPLQSTVDYIEPRNYFLQRKSRDSSSSQSHHFKAQQRHLTKNQEIISYDACQNTAKDRGTLNRITEVTKKCNSYGIAEDNSQSPVNSLRSHMNHKSEETLKNNINVVIRGTKSDHSKEDKVAVVGNSNTDEALLQENLPILPLIGNLVNYLTPQEVNSNESAIHNKTLGSSSTSLEMSLMPNNEIIKCSSSESGSRKSKSPMTLLDNIPFQTRCAQSSPQSITQKNLPIPDVKLASDLMQQDKNSNIITGSSDIGIHSLEQTHIETLPIMPIIGTGIRCDVPPSYRAYRSPCLVPIICNKTDSDEHIVKREAIESSNFSTPTMCLDSSVHSSGLLSYTDQRSQSVSPNKRAISFDHVNIKSECVSPTANEEPKSISIAIKKECISPDILQNETAMLKSPATENLCPSDNFVKYFCEIEKKKTKLTSAIPENNVQGCESLNLSLPNQIENLTSVTLAPKLFVEYSDFMASISSPGGLSSLNMPSSSEKNRGDYESHAASKESEERKSGSLVSSKKRSHSPSDSDSKLHLHFKRVKKSRSRSSSRHKNSRSRSSSCHREKKEIRSANYKDTSSRSISYHKKLSCKSTSFHKKSRSRSTSYHKKSRSRSTSYNKKSRSRSTSYHKKPKLRSTSKHKKSKDVKKSNSKNIHKKSRSRSTSYHNKPRSRSISHHKKSRSRSTSYNKKSRSRSTSYRKKPKLRSTGKHKKSKDVKKSKSKSIHKKSRSRSISHHKKSRSRSTSYHEKSKHVEKSKSKSNHKKLVKEKEPESEHYDKKSTFKPSSPTSVKKSTDEEDLISQRLHAALRKQIGEKLFKEYTKVLAKMKVTFEAESLAYKKTPTNHPNFKKIYKLFKDMNSAHGNVDKHHVKKLWKLFWESQYEDIKNEDWKSRQIQLIKDYEQKVPSKSSFLLLKPSISGNMPTTFSFDKALILLKTLCQKLSFMSPAISAIVKLCQDLGTTTKQAYNIINDRENLLLINMVLEKFRNICTTADDDDDDQYLYKMAIDWIPKLLNEAKSNAQDSDEEIHIDLQAMARISAGKDSKYIVDLIKTALEYEGISNPSLELVTEIVHKVCAINRT